jgi:hypothetical protein
MVVNNFVPEGRLKRPRNRQSSLRDGKKEDTEPSAEALGYYQKSLTGLEKPDTAP